MSPRLNFIRYFAAKEKIRAQPSPRLHGRGRGAAGSRSALPRPLPRPPRCCTALRVSPPTTPCRPRTSTRSTPTPGRPRASARSARPSPASPFDAADGGKLYGVTAGVYLAGTERQLLTINPATGASTVVGSLGANEIEDIAFTALGQLYGWNETGDDLYSINKATGALTKVGESGLGVTFGDGIAFDRNGWLWGTLDGDFGHVSAINPGTGAGHRSGARAHRLARTSPAT